jgi:hypothetical protein
MTDAADRRTVAVVALECKNQDTCPNKPCKRRGRDGTKLDTAVKRYGCRASMLTLVGSAPGS